MVLLRLMICFLFLVPISGQAGGAPANKFNHQAGEVRDNEKDGLKYLWIPAGTFSMGCSQGDTECGDDEKPSHRVHLTRGFWMGQTEVTVRAYKRYAAERGKVMPPEPMEADKPLNPGWADGRMPIVDVTWDEAQEYCRWVGGRLPTEAEWEYAARAGDTASRYGPIDDIAWYADNSGSQRFDSAKFWADQNNYPQRLNANGNGMKGVGQKRANAWGVYDMLGNLWEWVNDWYTPNYYQSSSAVDPLGPSQGTRKVLRGGSWAHYERDIRVSTRAGTPPSSRGAHGHGFRCVTQANPSEGR